MNAMRAFFAKFQKDERSVTTIEYSLIAIAMTVAIFSNTTQGGFIEELKYAYTTVSTTLESTTTSVSTSASTNLK